MAKVVLGSHAEAKMYLGKTKSIFRAN